MSEISFTCQCILEESKETQEASSVGLSSTVLEVFDSAHTKPLLARSVW